MTRNIKNRKTYKKQGVMKFGIIVLALALVVSGCIKNEENRGFVTDFTDFSAIQKGQTREEVQANLGSPSSKSAFGKETWYYIGMKMQTQAFHDPKVVNQDVVSITFNDEGKVDSIDRQKNNGGRDIKVAKDITPTGGNKVGLAEQLLGNLGRFNPKDSGE